MVLWYNLTQFGKLSAVMKCFYNLKIFYDNAPIMFLNLSPQNDKSEKTPPVSAGTPFTMVGNITGGLPTPRIDQFSNMFDSDGKFYRYVAMQHSADMFRF